ncbi:MAG: sulfite exporter TauE/SafE family protein [Crocinitomicaceae bacterium]
MTVQTLIILIFIGLFAGVMSGFVGIGGGVIIVPALVYIMGLSQHEAQGTSLLLMLPPIGILAVMNYYKAGQMNISYGVIIAIAFVIGGFFGSKISLQLSKGKVQLIFGALLLYVAVKYIYSGITTTIDEKRNHTESVKRDS